MTPLTHCTHCEAALIPADEEHRYPRCSCCGAPHAHHDLSPDKFPLTIRIYSGKTGKLLWLRSVTLDEAQGRAKVTIPGYAGTEHYPVRTEIAYADGTADDGGME